VLRELLPISIIVLMFAIAIYAGPLVLTNGQGEVPVRWSEYGQATIWASPATVLYLVPILAAIFYFAFMLLPHIGVHRKGVEHFASQFWGFKVIFVFVMAVIYIATLLPSLGIWGSIDPLYIIVPAIALIFFYVGYMLNHGTAAGINESRSAASERVWANTNKFGGRLFWLCGVLVLASLVAPADSRLWFLLLPLIFCALAVFAYSIFEYKKACRAQRPAKKGKARKKRRKKQEV